MLLFNFFAGPLVLMGSADQLNGNYLEVAKRIVQTHLKKKKKSQVFLRFQEN